MSVNKVILVGNVGKDPDVRYLEKNVAVANFPLATTEKGYKMSNGTEVPDRTEWHNIVVWRGLAEFCEKYCNRFCKNERNDSRHRCQPAECYGRCSRC